MRKYKTELRVINRASFCCSKKVRKLNLFSMKVAFMRKHCKRH